MFQNKKMVVILVIVMVLSLFANWKYIFPEKKKPNVTTAEDVQKSSGTAMAAKVETSVKKNEKKEKVPAKDDKPADYAKMLALSEENDWSGDPFGLLSLVEVKKVEAVVVQPNIEPQEEKEETINLRLESILVTPFGGIAIINHQSLEKGDEISGGKIVRITPQAVYWEKNGKIKELTLPEDKIPMSYVRD